MVPFRCIAADPPWQFGDSLPGKSRGASKNYRAMSTPELCALQLPPIADDALLFMWRVAAMPVDALAVARSWGFAPKSELVWVKTTSARADAALHFGMGRYVRASHETCIVAARGQASKLVLDHSVRSVFFAPTGAHSAKPEAFFDLVERLCGGPRLELFSRARRPGWTTLGDELGTNLTVRGEAAE